MAVVSPLAALKSRAGGVNRTCSILFRSMLDVVSSESDDAVFKPFCTSWSFSQLSVPFVAIMVFHLVAATAVRRVRNSSTFLNVYTLHYALARSAPSLSLLPFLGSFLTRGARVTGQSAAHISVSTLHRRCYTRKSLSSTEPVAVLSYSFACCTFEALVLRSLKFNQRIPSTSCLLPFHKSNVYSPRPRS